MFVNCTWEYVSEIAEKLKVVDPADIDDAPAAEPPTCITVMFFAPTEFQDITTGEISTHVAPCGRCFPFFMEKAARRYFEYCKRRYGEKKVSIEYD